MHATHEAAAYSASEAMSHESWLPSCCACTCLGLRPLVTSSRSVPGLLLAWELSVGLIGVCWSAFVTSVPVTVFDRHTLQPLCG
jgi:hypothetical protein